jgi:rhodanese-related sulfurtransferase
MSRYSTACSNFPRQRSFIPAHDYKGDTVSTIGEEKAFNPRLQVKSVEEYVDLMNNLKLANPKMMDIAVPANVKVGLAQEKIALRGWAVTATQALALVGKPDIALIDLRERSERERHGTIPGSLHVPYPALQENISEGGTLHELAKSTNKRLLFYCAFGERLGDGGASGARRGSRIRVPYPGRHRRLEENVRPAQSLKSLRDERAGFLPEKSIRRRQDQWPFCFGLPPP